MCLGLDVANMDHVGCWKCLINCFYLQQILHFCHKIAFIGKNTFIGIFPSRSTSQNESLKDTEVKDYGSLKDMEV